MGKAGGGDCGGDNVACSRHENGRVRVCVPVKATMRLRYCLFRVVGIRIGGRREERFFFPFNLLFVPYRNVRETGTSR